MSDEFTHFRKPTEGEMRLIRQLVARAADLTLAADWADTLRVQSMADGSMGSLKLSPASGFQLDRVMGRKAAEVEFQDTDGVAVLASLNVDRDGQLLELDIWKTDFSPLIRVPSHHS